jgi:hypothetical protein
MPFAKPFLDSLECENSPQKNTLIGTYEVNKKGGRGGDIIKLIPYSSFTIILNYFL